MKFEGMKFEDWMVGKKVMEIATGDYGEVVGGYPAGGEDSIDIRWYTGSFADETLWLDLDKIVFIDSPQDSPSIEDKLAQIEKLVDEIRAMSKEKEDA